MGCPVCENRSGPETLLESLCKTHFAECKGPTDEELQDAVDKGRRDAEAYRRSIRGSRPRRT